MAGNDYVNIFDLTYYAINAIKQKYLVDYREKMKGKVVDYNHASTTLILKIRFL